MRASAPHFFPVFALLISLWVPAKAQEAAPRTTLAEADRLAMLYNWPRALPLYVNAEREFRRLNDRKGELEARLGWIRAQANATPSSGGGTVVRIAPRFDSPKGRYSNLIIPTDLSGRRPLRS
jgi:hypothetical protein